MLHMLSYFSTATSEFKDSDLAKIIDVAVSTNQKLGVTGLLCYRDRCFAQFLEGEESVVKNLYEKIKKDSRHTACFIMLEKPIETRLFDKWYMALRDVDDFEGEQKDILLELFKINLDKKCASHARLTEVLLGTFKRASLGAAKVSRLSQSRLSQPQTGLASEVARHETPQRSGSAARYR
jgi:hypothetical protein